MRKRQSLNSNVDADAEMSKPRFPDGLQKLHILIRFSLLWCECVYMKNICTIINIYAVYVSNRYRDPFTGSYLGWMGSKSNDRIKFRMFQGRSSTKGFPIFYYSIKISNLHQIIITRL